MHIHTSVCKHWLSYNSDPWCALAIAFDLDQASDFVSHLVFSSLLPGLQARLACPRSGDGSHLGNEMGADRLESIPRSIGAV